MYSCSLSSSSVLQRVCNIYAYYKLDLTGLSIAYSATEAPTGLPIGYSVIVALTGLPIGYSVIVATSNKSQSIGYHISYGYKFSWHIFTIK